MYLFLLQYSPDMLCVTYHVCRENSASQIFTECWRTHQNIFPGIKIDNFPFKNRYSNSEFPLKTHML